MFEVLGIVIVLAPAIDHAMNLIVALVLKIGENVGTRSAASTPDLFKDLRLTLANSCVAAITPPHLALALAPSHHDLAVTIGKGAGCLIIITQVNIRWAYRNTQCKLI